MKHTSTECRNRPWIVNSKFQLSLSILLFQFQLIYQKKSFNQKSIKYQIKKSLFTLLKTYIIIVHHCSIHITTLLNKRWISCTPAAMAPLLVSPSSPSLAASPATLVSVSTMPRRRLTLPSTSQTWRPSAWRSTPLEDLLSKPPDCRVHQEPVREASGSCLLFCGGQSSFWWILGGLFSRLDLCIQVLYGGQHMGGHDLHLLRGVDGHAGDREQGLHSWTKESWNEPSDKNYRGGRDGLEELTEWDPRGVHQQLASLSKYFGSNVE